MGFLKSSWQANKQESLENVCEVKPLIVRMNVNIHKKFYKEIKQRALDEDITVTELVHKAVREYLNKQMIS